MSLKSKENMKDNQAYITDEERRRCQKVADAFVELFENEDLIVLNAGRYGFVKLQYFKYPAGFETTDIFYDSRSLFDTLWEDWLNTQLLNIASGTPMEKMDYADILKSLPEEKQKDLLDRRLRFAEKAGF